MIDRHWAALPTPTPGNSTGALRIAIASVDIAGPYHCGGVGAAYHGLALALAQAGHDVTVVYLHHRFHQGDHAEWTEYFHTRGIRFVHLPDEPQSTVWFGNRKQASLRCCQWLREQSPFDVVHFPEWLGLPYYSLVTKKSGLAFAGTTLCVGTHGPMRWSREGDEALISRTEDLVVDFMERKSVELADVVISPSQYLLNWIANEGWSLPAETYVANNVLEPLGRGESVADSPIRELVFFGRLDRRKGLPFFCDTLDRLAPLPFSLTFLGSNVVVDDKASVNYIRERALAWGAEPLLLTSLSRIDALRYLQEPGRLAVIPSQMDNSPCTVQECLLEGIPFLASDRGGIPELVHAEDRSRVVAPLKVADFTARIQEILRSGQRPARPIPALEHSGLRWRRWHETIPANRPQTVTISGELPFISICIAHFERPQLLEKMIESIRRQTYSRLEVIVVDDGSASEAARVYLSSLEQDFAQRNWKKLRQENAGPGVARDRAARAAKSSHILFADDDDELLPHTVETFARAAAYSGADVLCCVLKEFEGTPERAELNGSYKLLIPLGPALAPCLIYPEAGGTLYLFKRECYFAVGGFSPERNVDEDWELLVNVLIQGFDLQVIPEPLVWYRSQPESRSRADNRFIRNRSRLRIYEKALPAPLRDLADLAFVGLSRVPDAGTQKRTERVVSVLEKVRKQRLDAQKTDAAR